MKIGEKIKKLRIEHGLTQDELASKLFVKRQTVSKWERDVNEPDIDTIKKLSNIFSISLDDLLDVDEKEQSTSLKKDRAFKVLFFIQIWLVSFALLNILGMMPFLPSIVPLHFDINWNVDRYSTKWELLVLFLPILIIFIITTIIYIYYQRNKSDTTNLLNRFLGAFIVYMSITLAILLLLTVIEIVALMLYVKSWYALLFVRVMTFEMGAIILPVSILSYPKFNSSPNPYFGFRTLTSLNNQEVWYKLNRFASIMMFCSAIIVYLLPLFIDSYFVSFSCFSIIIFLIPVLLLNEVERRKLKRNK